MLRRPTMADVVLHRCCRSSWPNSCALAPLAAVSTPTRLKNAPTQSGDSPAPAGSSGRRPNFRSKLAARPKAHGYAVGSAPRKKMSSIPSNPAGNVELFISPYFCNLSPQKPGLNLRPGQQ